MPRIIGRYWPILGNLAILANTKYWPIILTVRLFKSTLKVPQIYKGESTSCNQYRELGILVSANEIKLAAASKSREDTVGILEGADKSKSFNNAEDLEVGGRLLK